MYLLHQESQNRAYFIVEKVPTLHRHAPLECHWIKNAKTELNRTNKVNGELKSYHKSLSWCIIIDCAPYDSV